MRAEKLNLAQFYKSVTEQEHEESQYERIISIPTEAIGTLRKELLETLGEDRTKGFLLRYGWHSGISDAIKMKHLNWENAQELMLAGPKMHILHGYLQDANILVNEVDFKNKTMHMEAHWINSYEAQEYIKQFGHSIHPVCHNLIGYASGYLSTILGEKVIVKEVKCLAMGHDYCECICRTVKEWSGKIDKELKYYEANSLINELEQTYEKLLLERDNLNKAYNIHEKLMKEVLQENGLSSIAKLLHEATDLPVLIEDQNENVVTVAGIPYKEAQKRHRPIKINKTELIEQSGVHLKLITPIFLQQKIIGYCSFLYKESMPTELDRMILERAALACSTILLNERTRLNTEHKIRRNFLEDILSGSMCKKEMSKRAYYLDFKLNPPYFVINLNRSKQKNSMKQELVVNEELMNLLYMYFKDRNIHALLAQKAEDIVILISEDTFTESVHQKNKLLKKLLDYCQFKFPQESFRMGVSSSSFSIEDAAQLYNESLAALKVTNSSRNIVNFDSLGIEGILFQVKNDEMIQKFINKKIGKLIEEDKSMELTKTLYHYLNNGCNVHKTARNMNFSISGLRYRLQRLNEILESDINRPNVAFQLFLALQSLILMGELDIEIELEADTEFGTIK
ncbi:XylR N-terminal domain-containing protein [Halalkalibacterium ligniniphilum]|uniref:XylR N-terminal domain-containing protein n=1 Tax=Halalkalibacterium ligniniphilum TaxID=1134413 RepID=UPI000345A939|nr:XylR N-terminal domain-containing protein [Halalkalibacterium ligniniphilum]